MCFIFIVFKYEFCVSFRSLKGAETYLIVINVGSQYERVDLSVLSIIKEQHLAVHTSSVNSQYSVRCVFILLILFIFIFYLFFFGFSLQGHVEYNEFRDETQVGVGVGLWTIFYVICTSTVDYVFGCFNVQLGYSMVMEWCLRRFIILLYHRSFLLKYKTCKECKKKKRTIINL